MSPEGFLGVNLKLFSCFGREVCDLSGVSRCFWCFEQLRYTLSDINVREAA